MGNHPDNNVVEEVTTSHAVSGQSLNELGVYKLCTCDHILSEDVSTAQRTGEVCEQCNLKKLRDADLTTQYPSDAIWWSENYPVDDVSEHFDVARWKSKWSRRRLLE